MAVVFGAAAVAADRADESSCDVASLLRQQDPATIVDAEQVSPGQSAVSGGQDAMAHYRVTARVVVGIYIYIYYYYYDSGHFQVLYGKVPRDLQKKSRR